MSIAIQGAYAFCVSNQGSVRGLLYIALFVILPVAHPSRSITVPSCPLSREMSVSISCTTYV
jgi:hypothetical protein